MTEDFVDVMMDAREWYRVVAELRAGRPVPGFTLVMHEGDVALGLILEGESEPFTILKRPDVTIH
jgi:hypothetical protein